MAASTTLQSVAEIALITSLPSSSPSPSFRCCPESREWCLKEKQELRLQEMSREFPVKKGVKTFYAEIIKYENNTKILSGLEIQSFPILIQ